MSRIHVYLLIELVNLVAVPRSLDEIDFLLRLRENLLKVGLIIIQLFYVWLNFYVDLIEDILHLAFAFI